MPSKEGAALNLHTSYSMSSFIYLFIYICGCHLGKSSYIQSVFLTSSNDGQHHPGLPPGVKQVRSPVKSQPN